VTQESPVHPQPSSSTELLRVAGLRITAPRVAVLESLGAMPHVDTDTIAHAVRTRLGTVSTQAVYDVLAALVRAGLVRRIEPAGSPALFERQTGDNHHHLVCRQCGSVTDMDCAPGLAPCLTPALDSAQTHGFVIDEAEVTFWGICPRCQSEVPAPEEDAR
jgi:Fe2+ or Zn2+ uptake regulation protein